jgi:hypothetical protein
LLQSSKLLFDIQNLHPNYCITQMLQSSKAFVCQLHHKMLQSSQLLFGTQKLAPNSQHQKKCFQSSKLLFGTQKLAPNSNTKCFKAQSFCLALKKKAYTQLIAQQKCSKTQSFCLALKSLHPIIGNASKLQIHPSNFFKMRQDPEKKEEDTIKTPPSKHKTQSLSS